MSLLFNTLPLARLLPRGSERFNFAFMVTIVAVTHDDKYFSLADRVVKMEYGACAPYGKV